MSYPELLKTETNWTTTLNGAKTYASTGDACLDFFAVAGGMRYRRTQDQIALFDRAYIETPDLAMKLLFHLRDIHQGMGERRLFRRLLRHTAYMWPDSAIRNVRYIADFGRWDDLLCLLDTPAEDEAVKVIRLQLEKDLDALRRREEGEKNAHISLLAKWLPSDNASSGKTRRQARHLIKKLGMSPKEYRRTFTALRARIGLAERHLTEKHPEKVNYEAVPAQAMLKYRKAFARQDSKRFAAYLRDVTAGDKKMHADTLFPYEILRPYFSADTRYSYSSIASETDKVLEILWKQLPGAVGDANALSVVDTSGSMYWKPESGAVLPALMAQAMGLYCAERCTGAFHNLLMTFESTPHLMQVHGDTLRDKLLYIETLPWGGSTNLEAVFALVLDTAVKYEVKPQELPSVIYIFSDMEFNFCIDDAEDTVYENARKRFEAHGYPMPAVVFHNVNSWQLQAPVSAKTKGTALSSGAGTVGMEYSYDGNITPMDHMLRVLGSSRYAMITA